MSDLSILFPERNVEIAGEIITLRPFSFGDIPKIIKSLGNILGIALGNREALDNLKFEEKDGQMKLKFSPAVITFFTELLGDSGVDLLFIIAIGAKKPLSYVESLPPDEGLKLMIEIVETNYDFFTKRLRNAWPGLVERINKLIPQVEKKDMEK